VSKDWDECMNKYSKLGITGFVLGIISIFCILLDLLLEPIWPSEYGVYAILLFVLSIILGVYAIIVGAIAYFGKRKDKIGLIGSILGFIAILIFIVAFQIAWSCAC